MKKFKNMDAVLILVGVWLLVSRLGEFLPMLVRPFVILVALAVTPYLLGEAEVRTRVERLLHFEVPAFMVASLVAIILSPDNLTMLSRSVSLLIGVVGFRELARRFRKLSW